MNYAKIIDFDVTNGEGVGCSLFVQGCPFHCDGCFNPETWDFSAGRKFTDKTEKMFFQTCDHSYIKRISILGGEPLADQNVKRIYQLVCNLKLLFPNKKLWIYTGFKIDNFLKRICYNENDLYRMYTISKCDYVVDGQYEKDKHEYTLKFRGSANQRIIDIKQSLLQNNIILLGGNHDNHA